jgi:hypothetical protein
MAARSTFTRSAGNTITAALNNSIRDHLVTYTGSNDVATEGQLCVNTSTGQLVVYTGSVARELARYGSLTAFTAMALTQGAAEPVTVGTGSGWSRQGPWVDAHINLTFPSAGTGTAGSPILVSSSDLPNPPATCTAGSFVYTDTGTTNYAGSVQMNTAGSMILFVGATVAGLGQAPSFSLTSADSLRITLRYAV